MVGCIPYTHIIPSEPRTTQTTNQWLQTTTRSGDPPLSNLGHQQAYETGTFLDSLLAKDDISLDNIAWMSSPFLRTLQTSDQAIRAFRKVPQLESRVQLKDFKILPEYSVFEWDGKGGEWHASLPPLEERIHYFPRLDLSYQSLFVPEIPEPRSKFHSRCERAIQLLNKRFPYRPGTALVVVTHAAACIGLCKAAIQGQLQDVTPAAPCSVYRLTRNSPTQTVWDLDPHDAVGSLNGHSDHISDLGTNTVPWNNFGDKMIHGGYTGPQNSRFAPAELKKSFQDKSDSQS